tara:strand:+ start:622 stop:957 length:336 start_codon:yes stop_codon:yes gene_type:complete
MERLLIEAAEFNLLLPPINFERQRLSQTIPKDVWSSALHQGHVGDARWYPVAMRVDRPCRGLAEPIHGQSQDIQLGLGVLPPQHQTFIIRQGLQLREHDDSMHRLQNVMEF